MAINVTGLFMSAKSALQLAPGPLRASLAQPLLPLPGEAKGGSPLRPPTLGTWKPCAVGLGRGGSLTRKLLTQLLLLIHSVFAKHLPNICQARHQGLALGAGKFPVSA